MKNSSCERTFLQTFLSEIVTAFSMVWCLVQRVSSIPFDTFSCFVVNILSLSFVSTRLKTDNNNGEKKMTRNCCLPYSHPISFLCLSMLCICPLLYICLFNICFAECARQRQAPHSNHHFVCPIYSACNNNYSCHFSCWLLNACTAK